MAVPPDASKTVTNGAAAASATMLPVLKSCEDFRPVTKGPWDVPHALKNYFVAQKN